VQAVEDTSAQLQQQLAQKGTDLSSAEHKVTCLQQLLSKTDQSKHAPTQVNLVLCLCLDTILHMATGLYYCNCLPSIKDECCADAHSVHFVSALSEEDCCMTVQDGFLC